MRDACFLYLASPDIDSTGFLQPVVCAIYVLQFLCKICKFTLSQIKRFQSQEPSYRSLSEGLHGQKV